MSNKFSPEMEQKIADLGNDLVRELVHSPRPVEEKFKMIENFAKLKHVRGLAAVSSALHEQGKGGLRGYHHDSSNLLKLSEFAGQKASEVNQELAEQKLGPAKSPEAAFADPPVPTKVHQ